MLDILRKISGGSRPATASQLRGALAEIDEAAVVAAVETAEAEYREALLSADEKRLAKAETVLAHARRDLDRCRAAIEALTMKATEADVAEAAATLDKERSDLDREADVVAAELKKTYPTAARQIISVLERLIAAEEKVNAFNQRMVRRQAPTIKSVEERAFPLPSSVYAPLFSVLHTSLQPCGGQEGWGSAKDASELNGHLPK